MLVNADGTSTGLGDRSMSDESLAVTAGSAVAEFRADGEVSLVCAPAYTIVSNVLNVRRRAGGCPAPGICTLHNEVVEHETRYR